MKELQNILAQLILMQVYNEMEDINFSISMITALLKYLFHNEFVCLYFAVIDCLD